MIRRLALVLASITIFCIANRGAFEGYFSDDDLDNLSWATVAGTPGLLRDFVSLRFSENNTRATGALFYKVLGNSFGLEFGRYVPWLFGVHLLNCALLGWLAHRRGASEFGAWTAAVFWGFHAALLEAWWKPMYCFDLLCASFCLLTWHLFQSHRFWPALLTFLVAYRAKEVAVFLPFAMAFDGGPRVWALAILSLNFSVQAMRANSGRDNDYTLRFRLDSLYTTIPYYAKHFFNYKWGALVLAPLAWFWRERQFWLGVLGSLIMLAPLLFLPKRLFSVYWYVPMIPLALGLAFVFAKAPRRLLLAGLACWLALNYAKLREKRNAELALAQENRAYVQQLTTFYALRPFPRQIFLEGRPPGLQPHGVQGALTLTTGQRDVRILNAELEEHRQLAANQDLMTLQWFRPTKTLSIVPHRYREAKLSDLDLTLPQSAWALRGGWTGWENEGRLAGASARLALYAPPDSARFLFTWAARSAGTKLLMNGMPIGEAKGAAQETFALPKAVQGEIELELQSSNQAILRRVQVLP
jgi:hypothetical protein